MALPTGTVTFLLTEQPGDPEASARVGARLAGAIDEHGGLPAGPGIAVFPRASDAVRAAAALLAAAGEESPRAPVALRAAVHTGEAHVDVDGASYVGPAATRAALLREVAAEGEVLVSNVTRDLVVDELDASFGLVDLGELRLRDLARAERVWQLVVDGVDVRPRVAAGVDRTPNNLPSNITPFVGRAADIADLAATLTSARLVTVVGTGGSGKTRLAQRVGAEVASECPDGVWWVDLSPLTDPSLVADAVAASVDPHVDPGRALVILDGCEHVADAVAVTASALLASSADVRVLATSRARLGVSGEVLWRMPPMRDAPVLFVGCARRVRPGLTVDAAGAAVVEEICARLDGVPLAIELAAARCNILSVERIRDGLEDLFAMLHGSSSGIVDRHRTMEASIEWSARLLSDPERRLLNRLSVFASAFSLESVEAVVPDEPLPAGDVVAHLEALVDQSLVQLTEDESAPFRLLEAVRQFARACLAADGEEHTLLERHAHYFRTKATSLWPLYGPDMVSLVHRAEAAHWDLVAALDHIAAHGEAEELGEMAASCLPALAVRHHGEAARWFAFVTDALGDEPCLLLGTLLLRWVDPLVYIGGGRQAFDLIGRAEDIGRTLGDERLLAEAAFWRAGFSTDADPAGARAAILDAREALLRTGDLHDAASAQWVAAMCSMALGDLESARAEFEEASRVTDECPRCRGQRLATEGLFALGCGELDRAERLADEASGAADEVGDLPGVAGITALRVRIAAARGDLDVSLRTSQEELRQRAQAQGLRHIRFDLVLAGAVAARLTDPTAVVDLLTEDVATRPVPNSNRLEAALVLAGAQHALGALDEADEALSIAASLNASLGNPGHDAHLATRRGWLAFDRGDLRGAEAQAHDALTFAAAAGPLEELLALELLGTAVAAQGGWRPAAQFLAAADAVRQATGFHARPQPEAEWVQAAWRRCEELAESAHELAAARREGVELDRSDLVGIAQRTWGARGRPLIGWDALTPTEARVCELVGEGLTNREVGARLLMGPETVKTHLSRSFRKLSLRNRAELAAELVRRRDPG